MRKITATRSPVISHSKFDKEFLRKVEQLSGVRVTLCDQCGVCSASCPMVLEMDLTPMRVMKFIQVGLKDVLDSKTPGICATCLSCAVRCPRGLDFAKVAEALRQLKVRKNVDLIRMENIPEEERKKLPQIALVSAFRKLIG